MPVTYAGLYRLFVEGGAYEGLPPANLVWLRRAHIAAALNDTHRPPGMNSAQAWAWHLARAEDCDAAAETHQQQEMAA